ncbi:MAG: hypothetical protein B7Y41_08100 [Hydrogenophilales bacterium 28-61-23]|nr:MAG: hypothetical protein B7Y41_08100 [Hydrogenophilales bacterium 28-61-23]
MEKIWVIRGQAGFKRVTVPALRSLDLMNGATCSRWKPTRTTISGEAWNRLAEQAAIHQVSIRELLEMMIHHGLSGLYRPGSWEAVSPFGTELYKPDGHADRWFQ